MEFHFLSILLFFAFLVFLSMQAKKRGKTQNPSSKLPPGPWQLPIIGNMHNMMLGQPLQIFGDLAHKYGPIVHLRLGHVPFVVISSPRMAKEIMKTHDLIFASRPKLLGVEKISYGYVDVAFAPYGDYWRQLRKICVLELLSSKRVDSLRPIREEETESLIRSIYASSHSPIDLGEEIFALLNNIVTKASIGRGCKDIELFGLFNKESNQLSGGFHVADFFPSVKFLSLLTGLKFRLERSHRKLDRVLSNIIEEHRQEHARNEDSLNGKYLIDVLLGLQQDASLDFQITTKNIKAILMDIVGAGSETSSTTIQWAMSEMVKNPHVMKKAQDEVRQAMQGKGKLEEGDIDELHYLKLVIKETMRLHPPLPLLIPRESRESCEIDGYHIPINTRVLINVWAIGRDPQYWDDPESFKPERFEGSQIDYKGSHFEFIPFGAGRRICPGMTLGLANVVLPLAQLLYCFDWKLPNGMKGEDLDMTGDCGLTLRKKNNLCLIPIPFMPFPLQ